MGKFSLILVVVGLFLSRNYAKKSEEDGDSSQDQEDTSTDSTPENDDSSGKSSIQTQNVGQNMVNSMRKRKGGWRRFRSCKSKNRWASLNPKCTNCTSKLPSCPTTENNKKSWMVVFSTTCDNFNNSTVARQDLKKPEYFVDLSKCGNFEEVKIGQG